MKNKRIRNVSSLIINICIVIFTIVSFFDSFRGDVIIDKDFLGFEGIHSLRFFTVLSNWFVAISALLMIIYNIKNIVSDDYKYPNWLMVLKHMATSAVALTFVTVALLLAPSYAIVGKGYFTLFIGNHVYMHLLSPVLAIITFVFFESSYIIKLKKTLFIGAFASCFLRNIIYYNGYFCW